MLNEEDAGAGDSPSMPAPDVVIASVPEQVTKYIFQKHQKAIPAEGFSVRLLSFLSSIREEGTLGLKALGFIEVEPRPYQIESALSILESMGGSGILADEVGLGKTIEAGLVIKEMILRRTARKILVLVPASLLAQWAEELTDKFGLTIADDSAIESLSDEFEGIMLLSLHKAKSRKVQTIFSTLAWDLVVVDEAHSLKNHLTLAHRFVFSLRRKYTVLLTATPIQNDLRELYNLINIVKPGYFKSIRLFRRKYMADRFTPRNPEELRRMCSRVMVRHRRSDTLIKLPPREVRTHFVHPSPTELEFYTLTLELARRAVSLLHVDEGDHIMLLLSILLKESTSSPQALLGTLEAAVLPKIVRETESVLLRQVLELGRSLSITAKMEWLLEEVASQPEEPIIVYTEYIKTQNKLMELMQGQGALVHRYAGNLRLKDKELALAAFRREGGVLLSTEVGGQGLNLQHCHRLVNFDLPWNPMKLEQRIGRIHRFGQQEKVQISTIAGKGTFEEYLVTILLSKIKLFEMVIGEIDSILAYLKNPIPMEKRISRIILTSPDTASIQRRLDNLANEILTAKEHFDQDRDSSAKLLDLPAAPEEVL
ncbi:DEAD/DEAH box helicase [Myxococcota bacterium]|nr:DEAD/DEAH box helicase [Myxococcota bacterium]